MAGVNGPVFHGITVTVDVPHFPTFDKWGWPVDEPRTVTRRFDRWGSDVEYAYTPGETSHADTLPVTGASAGLYPDHGAA